MVREMKIGGAWPKTPVGRSEEGNKGYTEFQEGQAGWLSWLDIFFFNMTKSQYHLARGRFI